MTNIVYDFILNKVRKKDNGWWDSWNTTWGNIEWDISEQTDLKNILDNKSDKLQNNLTATTNPTVTDDDTEWYSVLSVWINTSTNEIFKCLDNTTWAAVWIKTSLTIDELWSMALESTTDYYTKTETDNLLDNKVGKSNVLEKDNTTTFTPTADYHPATKKYVDDNAWGGGWGWNWPILSAVIAWEITIWTVIEMPVSKAITAWTFRVSLKTLPTGADVIVKLYKNGVEDASVTIATNASVTNWLYQWTDTTFVSGSYVAWDVLRVAITQIGSTLTGTGLSILLNE